MQSSATLLAFNRGLVDRRGLARVDVKRIESLSAEIMINFIPRVLGSMSIRPGWKYLGGTKGHLTAKLIPFIFAVDDTALLEITTGSLRVWWNDELITRVAVGTGITNGTFATDLTGWTDNDEAGAASTWAAGSYLQLLGDGTNAAIRDQEVTVAGGDIGAEHALRIIVNRGPVSLRVGSILGGEDYVGETSLGVGTHSLAFTPSGNFWIRFFARLTRPTLVSSVTVEAAGVMTISVPWLEDDLDNLRWDQSGDIVFVAAADVQQQQIERRSINSWSVVAFEPEDGPFKVENITNITLTPSAIIGSITVTASKSIFRSEHVGGLFSITSEGQTVTSNISAQDTWTNVIRITGVDASRVFTIILSGTWSATVTLQRSLDSDTGPWEDVTTVSWTANTTETYDDGLDNQIAYYRIGVKTGQYTSGTVVATLDYGLGAITGVVRITGYTNGVSVSADVLSDLGGTDATVIWAEGEWSEYRGWPTAVAFHEGRLWWAGKSSIWGSVTDAFNSYSPDIEGDSGTISRRLGAGPVDRINWLASSQRLLIGADINEYAARSSSLDEPLTPTAFNVKKTSNQGSGRVMPAQIDSSSVFVNRTGIKVFENKLNATGSFDYSVTDLCKLVPEIGSPKIVRMAVQRQPDTRIHCVRSDGTVALAVIDATEEVLGWCEVETDGFVEDAVVLPAQPGVTDDYVYYIVKREINGATVRYLEKWAQASDAVGGLGLGVTGATYLEFTDYAVAITDNTILLGDSVALQSPETFGSFYTAGAGSDDLWVHPVAGFPVGASQIDPGLDPIRTPGQSGAQSADGTKYWLSGSDFAISGQPSCPVRCIDLETGTTTTFEVANYIIMGAIDNYLIVYSAGSALLLQPDFGAPTLGAVITTWGPAPDNSISFILQWDSNGWGWTQGSGFLYRFKPGFDMRKEAYPTPPDITQPSALCMPTYDAVRHAVLICFQDFVATDPVLPGIWRYIGWSDTVDSAGTWVRLSTGLAANDLYRAIWHDEDSDTIFVVTQTGWQQYVPGARRFTGDGKFIDYVHIAGGEEVPYIISTTRHIYYHNNCGWLTVSSGGEIFVLRLCYTGPQILEGPEGDSLIPGGSTGRLHDLADSYINYTGTPITVVTGLDHLEGESVVVWGNGVDLGTTASYGQTYTVASGQITLLEATTNLTVGLPYTAKFKSSKLGIVTKTELLFGKEKRITAIALVLADTHAKGIRFGPDFDNLDDRPLRDEWVDVDPDNIDTDYDSDMIQFPSTWSPDTRICLQSQAPRPCTVLAVKIDMEV